MDIPSRLRAAAGGLLWRTTQTGTEIAVVSRRRDSGNEWVLPKGKLEKNESWQAAALREVREETGYRARLLGYAGAIAYQAKGEPKIVRFWHMAPTDDPPEAVDPKEIAAVAWMRADAAIAQLDFPLERGLLEASQPPSDAALPARGPRWLAFVQPTSLRRLSNTVDIIDADIEADVDEAAPGVASVAAWPGRARRLVAGARQAVGEWDAERGWRYLKAADRCRLHGMTPDDLRAEAAPMLAEARDERKGLPKWRAEGIQKLLADDDGKVKVSLRAQDVARARRLLDEHHDNLYQKLAILKRRLWLLTILTAVALGVWLWFLPLDTLRHAEATKASETPRLMWCGIVLAGILGALFSGFSSSIATDQKQSNIPTELATSAVVFGRLSMAVIAALAVSMLLITGILNIGNPNYEWMLAIAFIAGFSDRLLLKAIGSDLNLK